LGPVPLDSEEENDELVEADADADEEGGLEDSDSGELLSRAKMLGSFLENSPPIIPHSEVG
jgi:hypothetical protein